MKAPEGLAFDRVRLLGLLTRDSFAKKKVVLSSGKESNFYIDCKRTVLTAEGHWLVGRLLWAEIAARCPEAKGVGGLTMGADPLASAVSLVSHLAMKPMNAFLVRKEPKGHGSGQWIEGLNALKTGEGGDTVAIVEDVITTGASMLKAIERARAEGLKVGAAFALVDRQEGGKEAIAEAGCPVYPLFGRSDFPA